MLSATVPVDATTYAAHAPLSGGGQVFDLDLQANERACRLAFTAINGDGSTVSCQAIGRMIPEEGWAFTADTAGQGLLAASGTHVSLSLAVGDWQAWVSLDFTQNYEA